MTDLEEEFELRIEVIAASGLHRAEERIEWIRREHPRSTSAARREEPTPSTSVADLAEHPALALVEPDAVGAPATSPRRRRRRSRKKRSQGEPGPDAPPRATDAAGATDSGAAPDPDATSDDPGQTDPPARKRRRRSRRRRTTEPLPGTDAASRSEEGPAPERQDAPARKRRRRRPRRKKTADKHAE